MRHSRCQPGEHRLRLAAHQISKSWCNAAVRDVHHERIDLLLEQLHRQVRERALAGRAITDLTGIFAQVLNEFFDVGYWQRTVDHQHIRRSANHADGGKVFDGVIGQLARGGAGAVGGHIALQQGVAVRCSSRGRLACNHTTAAALVVHNKTLLELIAPALGDGPAHHVAAAASRYRHDVANRFGGIAGLSLHEAGYINEGRCCL